MCDDISILEPSASENIAWQADKLLSNSFLLDSDIKALQAYRQG